MTVSELFQNGRRPNILIIITDQERTLQHWPESFSEEHLPAMERLKRHGLTFRHHYTNSCMCSPSRSTLLTSQFPVKTGVTRTGSPGPPRHLPTTIPNLATVMKEAGYPRVEWHGKWHVGNTPSDYGFDGWQPPDAGNYLAVNDTLGGGTPDNDGRFLRNLCGSLERYANAREDISGSSSSNNSNDSNRDDDGRIVKDDNPQQQEQPEDLLPSADDESAPSSASAAAAAGEPFCIVASFVNPHDVYVAQHGPAKGYTRKDLHAVTVPLPPNCDEDTDENGKPRAQGRMSSRCVPFECTQQEYVNFYAHLHAVVDGRIGTLLDKVEELGFVDDTLVIRTSDHGEQGLSHSLVEKFFNCYQESLNIPLVISNPIAFPEPRTTDALSSHLDLLPTLAGLLGHTIDGRRTATSEPTTMQGTDLTPVFDDPAVRSTTLAIENTGTTPSSSGEEPETTDEVERVEFESDGDAGRGAVGRPATGGASSKSKDKPNRRSFPGVQKSIHFTYDDIAFPGAPSKIRCLHRGTVKYAVYFTPNGEDADWEMYDLRTDPLEDDNLAGNPEFRELQNELERELVETMIRHETLPTAFPWPPTATPYSVGFDDHHHPPGIRGERLSPRERAASDRTRAGGRHRAGRHRPSPPPPRGADPVGSFVFRDEGETVSLTLGMKGIGSRCSHRDVSVLNVPREDVDTDDDEDRSGGPTTTTTTTIPVMVQVIVVVENFLPEKIRMSFGSPKAEITDIGHAIRENELVVRMTKRDPTVEWESFNA